MYKIPKNLLEEALTKITVGIHPNYSYLQINQLIQKLSNLQPYEEPKSSVLEPNSGNETKSGDKGAKKKVGK